MTVGKLIELLQELPKDAEVVICEYNSYHGDLEKDPEPDYYLHQNKEYFKTSRMLLNTKKNSKIVELTFQNLMIMKFSYYNLNKYGKYF